MTLRDLMKQIPEDLWDCIIMIYIPYMQDGNEGHYYPIIQASIDQLNKENPVILLEIYTN